MAHRGDNERTHGESIAAFFGCGEVRRLLRIRRKPKGDRKPSKSASFQLAGVRGDRGATAEQPTTGCYLHCGEVAAHPFAVQPQDAPQGPLSA